MSSLQGPVGARDLVKPTVHLNGTGKQTLIDEWQDAVNILNAAYRALKLCGPNGRDYYPQGPDACSAATGQHFDRLRVIDAVKGELEALIIHVEGEGS